MQICVPVLYHRPHHNIATAYSAIQCISATPSHVSRRRPFPSPPLFDRSFLAFVELCELDRIGSKPHLSLSLLASPICSLNVPIRCHCGVVRGINPTASHPSIQQACASIPSPHKGNPAPPTSNSKHRLLSANNRAVRAAFLSIFPYNNVNDASDTRFQNFVRFILRFYGLPLPLDCFPPPLDRSPSWRPLKDEM